MKLLFILSLILIFQQWVWSTIIMKFPGMNDYFLEKYNESEALNELNFLMKKSEKSRELFCLLLLLADVYEMKLSSSPSHERSFEIKTKLFDRNELFTKDQLDPDHGKNTTNLKKKFKIGNHEVESLWFPCLAPDGSKNRQVIYGFESDTAFLFQDLDGQNSALTGIVQKSSYYNDDTNEDEFEKSLSNPDLQDNKLLCDMSREMKFQVCALTVDAISRASKQSVSRPIIHKIASTGKYKIQDLHWNLYYPESNSEDSCPVINFRNKRVKVLHCDIPVSGAAKNTQFYLSLNLDSHKITANEESVFCIEKNGSNFIVRMKFLLPLINLNI